MSKHDLTYSLMGTKSLGSVTNALSNFSREKQERILQNFINALVTDKDKLFNHIIEDEELKSFMNHIKGKAFYKALKSCDKVSKRYPNLIGEIFAEYNHKGWRQDAGQFFTPQQIADELDRFGAKYDSIYDPCAGVGALLLGKNLVSETGVRYAGELEWVKFWYDLNALYHGETFTPYDDSIVDLMLLNPPFNTKIIDDQGKEKDGVLHFLELASNKANKLTLIIPTSFSRTNRTYKKAYAYFEEHFNVLGCKHLDNDVFSWFETKVNTMILYCENVTQRTRSELDKKAEEVNYYKKQYNSSEWESMGIEELKEMRLIVLDDLNNAHQVAMNNKIKDETVFQNKLDIGLEIQDDLMLLDKIALEKRPYKQLSLFK